MSSESSVNQPATGIVSAQVTLELPVMDAYNNTPTPYAGTLEVFNALSQEEKQTYRCLLHFWGVPKPTPFLDFKELKRFGWYNDVFQMLLHSGLGIMMDEDPGTHPMMVLEFMSTLEVPNKNSWSFKLGGKSWLLSKDDLCKYMGITCAQEGIIPQFNEEDRTNFWLILAKFPSKRFRPGLPAQYIDHPAWKIMHYIVANIINVREDGGQTVTAEDLDILRAIYNKTPLDWFRILSQRFMAYTDCRGRTRRRAMGGGAFITKIAMGCSLTFDHLGYQPMKTIVVFKYEKEDLIVTLSSSEDDGHSESG